MRLRLLAVGHKMPAWVEQGVAEYSKRLPADCCLEIVEIAPGYRAKNTPKEKAMQQEAEALSKAIKPQDHVIALDVQGKAWSTEQLAENLGNWRMQGGDVALIVGGPDGLTADILALAKQRWSLSALTLPHQIGRASCRERV